MNNNICQRCKQNNDQDIRHLVVECFYDLSEMEIPFDSFFFTRGESAITAFELNICKKCRADFIQSMKEWFENPQKPEPQTGYFVRKFGATFQADLLEGYPN